MLNLFGKNRTKFNGSQSRRPNSRSIKSARVGLYKEARKLETLERQKSDLEGKLKEAKSSGPKSLILRLKNDLEIKESQLRYQQKKVEARDSRFGNFHKQFRRAAKKRFGGSVQ